MLTIYKLHIEKVKHKNKQSKRALQSNDKNKENTVFLL